MRASSGETFEFWRLRMKDEQILRYILVPYLEEAATLLSAAGKLLPIWAIKRSEQLKSLACTITSKIDNIRRVTFSWASERETDYFCETLFSRVSRKKNKEGDEKISESSVAVVHLVSIATNMLFLLVPTIEKLNKLTSDRGEVKWIYEIIEELKEFPAYSYIGLPPKIPSKIMDAMHLRSIFSECEAICFTQAYVEDICLPKGKVISLKKRKENQICFSSQLEMLAERTLFPFSLLKATFLPDIVQFEQSPWYRVAREYTTLIEEKKHIVISSAFPFGASDLENAWNDGHTSPSIPSYLYGRGNEEKCLGSEIVARNLILLLIAFAGSGYLFNEDVDMMQKLVHS